MESHLLRLLLQNRSDFISRAQLQRELSIHEQALDSLLQMLISWEYRMEFHPTLGIRLLELPLSLHLDEVFAQLPPQFSWRIFHLKETSSTMDFLKREGIQGAPHGSIVIANQQTAGRGRLGRSWTSSPELGLYLSILLRPDFGVESYSRLTILTAVATLQTIEYLTSLHLQIKWPNDLMIGKRKLAGILTEVHRDHFGKPFAIVGLGLNLLHQTSDFPSELQSKASSLLMESGKSIRRTDLLVHWIQFYQKALLMPFDEISDLWKSRCLNLGELIQVHTEQGPLAGTALDLESNGSLILRTDSGKIHSILSGIVEI
ncbi:MAG: biotin--[acetyl-CoA-carboxylase] ligase [Verrucomicrobiota bacterium]